MIQKNVYRTNIFSVNSGVFDTRLKILTQALLVVLVTNIRYVLLLLLVLVLLLLLSLMLLLLSLPFFFSFCSSVYLEFLWFLFLMGLVITSLLEGSSVRLPSASYLTC